MMQPSEFVKKTSQAGIESIRIYVIDLHGRLRGKEFPIWEFEGVCERGIFFGPIFTLALDGEGIATPYGPGSSPMGDMKSMPTLSSYRRIPWEPKVGLLISELRTTDGENIGLDPIFTLKRQYEESVRMGYLLQAASEIEFYIYKLQEGRSVPYTQVLGQLKSPYDAERLDESSNILSKIESAAKAFGLDTCTRLVEYSAGQYEINFKHTDALRNAENTIFFKYIAKEIARRNGHYASFMPKPSTNEVGNSLHIHLSLADTKTGDNLFCNPDGKHGLSDLAYHFAAGLLAHAKALTAIMCPTVNSYKRLKPYSFAPYPITFGLDNRTTLIRVPSERGSGTRLELRLPDPSANVYYALATILRAGLDGVEKRMMPSEVIQGDAYSLSPKDLEEKMIDIIPQTLKESLEAFEDDQVVRSTFMNQKDVETFLRVKWYEWEQFNREVSEWERQQYFHIL